VIRGLSVPRVTAAGAVAGAAAMLLWVAYSWWPRAFVIPYVLALAVTVTCGAYILLATWYDSYRNPRRGSRIRPIRGFDIVSGLLLAGLGGWAIHPFLPAI
jgi:hypothetical protein